MPSRSRWCVFHSDLPDHPQTAVLAGACRRAGMPAAWSHLAYAFVPPLSCHLLQNGDSGDLSHLSLQRIAEICRWPGRAAPFVAALAEAAFLDVYAIGGSVPLPAAEAAERLRGLPVHDAPREQGLRVELHNWSHYHRHLLTDRLRKRKPSVEHPAEPSAEHSVEHPAEPSAEHSAEPPAEHSAEHPRNTPRLPYRTGSNSRVLSVTRRAVGSSGGVGGTAGGAGAPPDVDKNQRKDRTENNLERNWNTTARALRRAWGAVPDADLCVRRLLGWARNTWGLELDVLQHWGLLAAALWAHAEARQRGNREPVADLPAFTISRLQMGWESLPEGSQKQARTEWERQQAAEDGPPPAWMARLLEGIGERLHGT